MVCTHSKYYQLDFLMPEILPDLTSFKKTCRENPVNLLNRFLFIVAKHLFIVDIFEFFSDKTFNFKKAFQRIRAKILKFFIIDFKTKCC